MGLSQVPKKFWKWGIICAGCAILFAGWQGFKNRPSGTSFTYLTSQAEKGKIQQIIRSSGKMEPITTVLVGSQVTGRIQEIFADFNSVVQKGEIVAQIDPALFEARLAMAQAKLKEAEAERIKAERDWQRQKELFERKSISKSEADKFEALYQQAVAKKEQAQAEVDLAQSNLNYTTIRSPVDGIVISRDVDVGQTVAASLQAPTLFNIAKDLKEMQMLVEVDEADIGFIQPEQKVYFSVDTYPGEVFSGEVTHVRNAPRVIQNVVHFEVIVSVENKELKLKPGMTTHVLIVTRQKDDVLRVPNGALRFTPKDKPKEPFQPTEFDPVRSAASLKEATVWRLKKGKPEPVKIEIGLKDEFYTEVKKGLAQGDTLITGYQVSAITKKQKTSPLFRKK